MATDTVTLGDKPIDVDALFAPLQKALGKIVIEWGTLQDDLGQLFAVVMRHLPDGMHIAFSAWQSHSNDRAQREMLRSVASARFNPDQSKKPADALLLEIEWLLGRCDSVSEARNNFVHASYTMTHTPNGPELSSSVFFGNRRSKKLVDKDLLADADKCSRNIHALDRFCRNLVASAAFGKPLPGRPQLN
ncbi:hypothetical protein EJ076_23130 [Mesorhizobium sp. M7D.F.Ca.US.005.01.1.1]|uniref:hypothetical protein n=1 Tax=Mesorhizobium sp. M7D.F.Ca.US.005.01.1.1 TaxID=2493678 RepID=UPI000F74E45A|nr:hypothetical protein [Mesorhizobium sp. M7D.F.Ca.US.005.01.1.1]AZO43777.1 hypothetical protein EJ076_23130 [Mesorhizobium sp. M7D.F.Ca.US.005.01.1.1]